MNTDILKLRASLLLLDIFDLIAFLIFVVGIVLTVRFFIFNPFTVIGQSMAPTFDEGDFIIVDKITPRFGEFDRGDIVVFVPDGQDKPFIKRIIGIPGETVVIKNSNAYICQNDAVLNLETEEVDLDLCEISDVSFLTPGTNTTSGDKSVFPVEGGYFVAGDNREHSSDSRRCFGQICYPGAQYLAYPENIIGKVAVRLYPNVESF